MDPFMDPYISDRSMDPYISDRSIDPYILAGLWIPMVGPWFLNPYIQFMDQFIEPSILIYRPIFINDFCEHNTFSFRGLYEDPDDLETVPQ